MACPHQNSLDGTGFFRFGKDIICYGQSSTGVSATVEDSILFDAAKSSYVSEGQIHLPFDISQVVDLLRTEQYVKQLIPAHRNLTHFKLARESYYLVRDLLPVWVRRHFQRAYLKDWRRLPFPGWPVDFTVDSLHEAFLRLTMLAHGCDRVPFIWFWPDGAPSCLILTHDVESAVGRDFTSSLMDIDSSYGFRSSFQVVPKRRYSIPERFVDEIRTRGFELNIHDLNHDGHLFDEKNEFLRRAKEINEYARKYDAHGFRSGIMYRNLEWYDAYEFAYDMSVPNVAHLEPQRGGCCTVMPFFIGNVLELPLTTSQDYSIFHILNDYTIDLWKKQVSLIQQRNGLLSFITHPDYLIDRKCRRVYELLLAYLRKTTDENAIWAVIPKEVNRWWRARSEMKLVQEGSGYRIVGPESDRARIAYATLDGDRVVYSF